MHSGPVGFLDVSFAGTTNALGLLKLQLAADKFSTQNPAVASQKSGSKNNGFERAVTVGGREERAGRASV